MRRQLTAAVPAADTHRRLLLRRRLDGVLDWARFRLDTFPRAPLLVGLSQRTEYQPLPWAGVAGRKRGAATWSRWRAIDRRLASEGDLRTAIDLGAAGGFFTVKLAERGLSVVAVEDDPSAYRTALYVLRKARVANAGVLTVSLSPATVDLLPRVDVTLFLSLWHHLVRAEGLAEATAMLRRIWNRTGRLMFFETGESEMPPEFGLPPMEPSAREWLFALLSETCEHARIEHLGEHDAFDPAGGPVSRNLFAVCRTA